MAFFGDAQEKWQEKQAEMEEKKQEKLAEKEEKQAAKERDKQEKQAEKEREKQEKIAEKEREKQEKERAKQEEKDNKKYEKYMAMAIREAKQAADANEVPIGCIIVQDDKIIGRGFNRRNTDKNVLSHAEIIAISQACKKTKDWRLEDCEMYITLEPCQMCAGAIVQARIPHVIIGAMNAKAGCAGSVINLLQIQEFNHQVEITKGVLEEECSALLTQFFEDLREQKKQF